MSLMDIDGHWHILKRHHIQRKQLYQVPFELNSERIKRIMGMWMRVLFTLALQCYITLQLFLHVNLLYYQTHVEQVTQSCISESFTDGF